MNTPMKPKKQFWGMGLTDDVVWKATWTLNWVCVQNEFDWMSILYYRGISPVGEKSPPRFGIFQTSQGIHSPGLTRKSNRESEPPYVTGIYVSIYTCATLGIIRSLVERITHGSTANTLQNSGEKPYEL